MPRLIVHAGFPNTGSTSLQAMLARNAARLPGGIRYIRHDWPQIQDLRRKARTLPAGAPAGMLDDLADTARWVLGRIAPGEGETVILSSEDFCGGMPGWQGTDPFFESAPEVMAALETGFKPADLDFVLVTRDRDSWLRSRHAKISLDKRRVPPWDVWAARPGPAALDWSDVVARIGRATSAPVHVLAMEDDLAPPGPGAALLRLAGVPDAVIDGFAPADRLNAGPPSYAPKLMQSRLARSLPTRLRTTLSAYLKGRRR